MSLSCILFVLAQSRVGNQAEVFVSGIDSPFGITFDKDGSLLCTAEKSDGQGIILRITSSGMVAPIIESPKYQNGEDGMGDTYLLTRLGPISKLDDNTVASLDNSTGTLDVVDLPKPVLLKEPLFTDGRGPSYDMATGKVITIHSMASDRDNKTLFVAGPDNRSSFEIMNNIHPGLLVLKLDFGSRPITITTNENKRVLAPLSSTTFLKSSEYSSPQVTAMAVSKGIVVIALRGEGLLKIGPNQSISNIPSNTFKTSDVFGLTFDADGALYVAASQNGTNGTVYKVAANNGRIDVLAKGFKVPAGLAIREQTLYIADSAAGQILRIRLHR
jgi:outer membrane protein assembly factor BamB